MIILVQKSQMDESRNESISQEVTLNVCILSVVYMCKCAKRGTCLFQLQATYFRKPGF